MFSILLTKKLSQEHLDLIKSWEWNYEIVETLSISPAEVKGIPLNADTWIVSSRNSFAAVKKFINEPPNVIYCVGDWTKKEIEKLNTKGNVKSFENMRSLVRFGKTKFSKCDLLLWRRTSARIGGGI